jgi:hypothetical protein
MNDEKRQTRLLPFRLRRAGTERRDARDRFDREMRGEFDGAEDFSTDAELTALLRTWDAPPHTFEARARMLADFRASVGRAPVWRRALTAELRVPLPVAACAAFALLLSLFALGTRAWTHPAAPVESKSESATAVKIVEVPVVRERIVTRTIYVEKKERGAGRGVSSHDERETTGTQAGARREAERTAREGTPAAGYFTRVDMADFQPADEMKIRIVKKGSADEK